MIKPLSDYVVIRRLEAETTTKGGIFLPKRAVETSKKSTVVCVGDGKLLKNGEIRTPEVKKGDVVLFTSGAGTKVQIEGKKYLIMSESSIIAIEE